MQTNVRTPTEIFNQPQRLLVPLFQRPYVWNEERQWEPLWRDVERVAGRLLASGPDGLQPHFLGAVVIQQIQNTVGDLQTRIVIDGQQRLTTLQILLDAVHAVFELRGHAHAAARLSYLVENAEAFRRKPEDRFKVWPTNRDRDAFNEVMGVHPPIAYDTLKHSASRLVQAHKFFVQQTEEWLDEESAHDEHHRADALETAVSKLLQLVVIDLQVDENAQEIFELQEGRDGCVWTSGLRHSSTQVLGIPSQAQDRAYNARLSCDLRFLGWLRYTPLTLESFSPTHTFENIWCWDRKEVPTGFLTAKISEHQVLINRLESGIQSNFVS